MRADKKIGDQLERIKTTVRNNHDYFNPNYTRFNQFRKFVFESNWTADESALLLSKGQPDLEFNVTETYISRMLGEFMDNEPSLKVSSARERRPEPVIVDLVEQHMRAFLYDADLKHMSYRVFKDLLSGGFSVIKMWTDYVNNRSFDQDILASRAFDPTLCGFDMTAQESHKGDGSHCYELFPKSEEEFEAFLDELGITMDMSKITYSRDFAGFNWSYANAKEKILLVCDFYEKKKGSTKIVKLANGQVMTDRQYSDLKNNWTSIAQLPKIIGKPRTAPIEIVCRYRLVENQILDYKETDFSMLPLIFVDGNSELIKSTNNGNIVQFTKPYAWNAKGAQKLKNYAGVAWATELENTVQHKFMVKKEALPKEKEFLDALTDVQRASVIVTNAFYEEDPNLPIPDPIREIVRPPMPPEISNAFVGTDQIIQNIFGSFEGSLGRNSYQLSGVAIENGMLLSNAAAKPYLKGFLDGLQRVAEIYLDLFPKYHKTDRTIPIVDKEGNRSYLRINQNNEQDFSYEPGDLDIHITAGMSFQIQKSNALRTIEGLQKANPQFAQFFAEKGLKVLLDNVDIHSIDQLKILADEWIKEKQQEKQMMMQMQQQAMANNPQVMKTKNDQAKMQMDMQKSQAEFMMDMEKLKQAERKMLTDAEISHNQSAVQILKAETERFSKEVDLQLAHKDMAHRHTKEKIELHHKINSEQQQPDNRR